MISSAFCSGISFIKLKKIENDYGRKKLKELRFLAIKDKELEKRLKSAISYKRISIAIMFLWFIVVFLFAQNNAGL